MTQNWQHVHQMGLLIKYFVRDQLIGNQILTVLKMF
jgi:hypothetical protein